MALLTCAPPAAAGAAAADNFLCASFSLGSSGFSSSSPSLAAPTISLYHHRNCRRPSKREKNLQHHTSPSGVGVGVGVRCCEKKPSAPSPPLKKRVRIPSKRIKTDRPWWNLIFRNGDGAPSRHPSSSSSSPSSSPPPSGSSSGGSISVAGKVHITTSSNLQGQGVAYPLPNRDEGGGATTSAAAGLLPRHGGRAVIVDWPETASRAPLLEALKNCASQDMANFRFPGAHHGPGAAAASAVLRTHQAPEPELFPELASGMAAAQKQAALLFGADTTFFLINGTKCGIQAVVLTTCKPRDFIILPRNSHYDHASAATSAMVLAGAQPWYVIPEYDSYWGICHSVGGAAISAAISGVQASGGRVGAVLIESPSCHGVCSPVGEIAGICQESGVPLIVDEAHGAHFRFHEEFPLSALEQGADVVVQSPHEVLGSLAQSAMLHLRGRGRGGEGNGGKVMVDREMLGKCLQMVQSSSPSYVLLSSLDAALAQFRVFKNDDEEEEDNNAVVSSSSLEAAIDFAVVTKERLREISNVVILDEETIQQEGHGQSEGGGYTLELDPLRITVGLWRLDLDGYKAEEILRSKFGIVAEFAGAQSITFAIGSGTSARDVARLVEAWRSLSLWFFKEDNYITMEEEENSWRGDRDLIKAFQELPASVALSPRDAFFCKTVLVEADDAVGQICAELLCAQPPGIPVVTPGEIITERALELLRMTLVKGGMISGASNPCLRQISIYQVE